MSGSASRNQFQNNLAFSSPLFSSPQSNWVFIHLNTFFCRLDQRLRTRISRARQLVATSARCDSLRLVSTKSGPIDHQLLAPLVGSFQLTEINFKCVWPIHPRLPLPSSLVRGQVTSYNHYLAIFISITISITISIFISISISILILILISNSIGLSIHLSIYYPSRLTYYASRVYASCGRRLSPYCAFVTYPVCIY